MTIAIERRVQHELNSAVTCVEVTGHFNGRIRSRGEQGLCILREVENYRKWEEGDGPRETPLGLLPGASGRWAPVLPTEARRWGPDCR